VGLNGETMSLSDTATDEEVRTAISRERRQEYRRDRKRVDWLLEAYRRGDVESFVDNMTADEFPWPLAFAAFAKLTDVPTKFRRAFLFAWCEAKATTYMHAPMLCYVLRYAR
jgi:hypothetical protein